MPPGENLGAQVLDPVGVEVHHPELPQRLHVDQAGNGGVIARRLVGDHVAQVVHDVAVAAAHIERVLHAGMQEDWTDVWAEHIDTVELGVA